MKIDTTNLEERLKTLTGRDFEEAEKEERRTGNTMPMIQFTSGFLARLGARALGVNPHEIKNLPLNEYTDFIGRTTNFLYTGSGSDTTETESKSQETPSEN